MKNYRPEIDGLRALAVLPVIFFHAGFLRFSGGYVGVDVFFVISGYLITSILWNDLQSGSFSLKRFYERRARRILPALFVVAFATLPFAYLWLLPPDFRDYGRSLFSVSTFSSNFLFWRQNGYFDTAAELKPLLHTWSLAVEEQYYLLFPLLLWGLWKWEQASGGSRQTSRLASSRGAKAPWRSSIKDQMMDCRAPEGARNDGLSHHFCAHTKTVITLGFIGFVSFIAACFLSFRAPDAAFYLLPTRAWELMVGALCAISLRHPRPFPAVLAQSGSLFGLLLILTGVFAFDKTTPFPGFYALLPTLGAALVILFAKPETITGRLLSSRPFVGIGLVSYSAYLWHQPLFALAHRQKNAPVSDPVVFLLILVSLGLAYLTWRFVEQPCRNKQKVFTKPFVASVLALSILLGTTGYVIHTNEGFEAAYLAKLAPRQKELYAQAMRPRRMKDDGVCRFWTSLPTQAQKQRFETCAQKHGKAQIVFGDSHAMDLYQGVFQTSDYPFIVGISNRGCRPHDPKPECHFEEIYRFLEDHAQNIETLFYEQAGFYLLADAKGREGSRDFFKKAMYPVFIPYQEKIDAVVQILARLSRSFPVIWIGPRLEPHLDFPLILEKAMACDLGALTLPSALVTTFENLDRALTLKALSIPSLRYVSQIDAVRFDPRTDLYDCEKLYWKDTDHWSEEGAARFVRKLSSAFSFSSRPAGDAR